jgi:hypothetical protein
MVQNNRSNTQRNISEPDFVSLYCSSNQLDISKNTPLTDLDCSQNKLDITHINDSYNQLINENCEMVKEEESFQKQLITQLEEQELALIKKLKEENKLFSRQKELIAKEIQLKYDMLRLEEEINTLQKQKLDEKETLLKSFTVDKLMENEGLQNDANALKGELLRNKKEWEVHLEKINRELKTKEEASSSLH